MFGKRLKSIRKARNLSQTEVANKLGVTQGFVSRLEKDSRTPNVEMLRKLSAILGVSESNLLGKEEATTATGAAGVLADCDSPDGLKELAEDRVLSAAMNITDSEWHTLRSIDLPCFASKDGYVQLLVTIRSVCRA